MYRCKGRGILLIGQLNFTQYYRYRFISPVFSVSVCSGDAISL
nr:MAG TPA: hypothetical protein [Bacteriophage sp.]